VPGVTLAARYVTGDGNVGGDWYDVFVLPGGQLGIVVGDVAGSGIQAAVIMGRMRSSLRSYALETSDPGDVLRKLDRKIQYFERDELVASSPRGDAGLAPLAEDACAAVMRALLGNRAATDDIALLMLHRQRGSP
jgi:hypothetical protein